MLLQLRTQPHLVVAWQRQLSLLHPQSSCADDLLSPPLDSCYILHFVEVQCSENELMLGFFLNDCKLSVPCELDVAM
jgi:hypothetical protein